MMTWSVAGALWIGITAVSAGYYSPRLSNAQCFTNAVEYSGDRVDNPIFEGGGFIGSLTLEDCQSACDSRKDSKGRPCVAIEWSDGGNAQSDSTTKSCALAWACDYTQSWSGGSVFTKEYETKNANAQCYVEATEYSGDRLDNPIFEGGGFVGTMTLADCLDQCASSTDSRGRPCVAIEWSDGGNAQSESTTKSCALAWGCDYTKYWSGGSVFPIDHYGSRNLNAQCFVEETEYSGDRLDNPIFETGGFIGTMTLAQCKAECTSRTDSKGRPCVAIEWSDGGNAQSASTTKSCALAWGCDYTKHWTGGSVFVRSDVDLSWLGWSPGSGLTECEGDCDYDSDCSGNLLCFHDGVPPGCSGSVYSSYSDYCYDPSSSAKTAFFERPQAGDHPLDFLAEPEQTPWTLTLSGKDLAILVLVAVNLAVLVSVCFVCARSRTHGVVKKYQAVRMVGDSELEEVGLQ